MDRGEPGFSRATDTMFNALFDFADTMQRWARWLHRNALLLAALLFLLAVFLRILVAVQPHLGQHF